ncbi:MAG: tandem-95 repeat protein [candidate division KSB1 bacterium]|nr:tandem-95 repeat protein [candidate division KSB1 bacterium]
MRYFLVTLVVYVLMNFFMGHPSWAQTWSEEIAVSNGKSPDLDIDPKTGNLHIVAIVNGTGAVYTEMDNSGKLIRQEVIPRTEKEKSEYSFGASIAVDTSGNPHVTFREPLGGNYYSSYYTYRTATGWSSPVVVSQDVYRGYVVPIDIDKYGYAHIGRGSATGEGDEPMIGPVQYFKFLKSQLQGDKDGFYRYRCDDRLEIDASYQNQVHMILGCPDYPVAGGPVWYWRSFDGGAKWEGLEIHSSSAKGANGTPDVFVDASGNVHIVYGSEIDESIGGEPSVRYSRWVNKQLVRDVNVTVQNEIPVRDDTPQGIGSVAASADGNIVIVAYSEGFGQRLFVRRSDNGGATWGDRIKIAEESVGDLGRNKQVIRAYKSNFYVVYPTPGGIKMRYLKLTQNQPPVANAGGPYQADEGSIVNFDGSKSSDGDGKIVKYEWDFQNDGTYDQTSASPTASFKYTDDFKGQVKLRVTDNEGATATDTKSVTIANVAPTAKAGGPYSGEINKPVQLNGSATDPGNDVLTYQWDLDNDGIFETNGQSPQVTFKTGGTHIVKLKVTDDDGGVGTDQAQVVISNLPPVVSQIPPQTINEGGSFTPISLDNYVSDPDNNDAEITWTASGMNHLNVTITNRIATITVKDPEWSGSETITFTATDPGGLSASTATVFTVSPVNDPPVMTQIPNQTIDEGGNFNNIVLDDYVTDPDNSKSELNWSASGQNQLIVTITQRVASVQTPNQDWFGTENILFKVTDPGGLSDNKTVTFKVNPVNDPPVVSKIPDQTIDNSATFATFDLDDYVNDVDNAKSELTWSHNATKLVVKIDPVSHVTSVAVPNPQWSGSETITFTAKDPGGLSGENSATFTVGDFNDPPKVSQIPDQTILENGSFTPIQLDLYVYDPDHKDSEINWSWRGNKALIIKEFSRVVTIAVPDSEWAGTEVVTFIASDPGGKKDSCVTVFKVIPVNDPPVLGFISDLYFQEDDTLRLKRQDLLAIANDIDSPKESLQFFIVNMIRTHYRVDSNTKDLLIYGDSNWFGTETVQFQVLDDAGGFATRNVKIIVLSVPDPPSPFSLIFPVGTFFPEAPDSIRFVWQRSSDADPGEIPIYQWSLSQDVLFNHVMDQFNNLQDTIFTFKTKSLAHGTYYWRVIAFDPTWKFTMSKNVGVFKIGSTDVADESEHLPAQYVLEANYPNPFNPETTITFQVPERCHVRLTIYNNMGQLIATLIDEEVGPGIYTKVWNARDAAGNAVSTGVYLFKLESEKFKQVRKMLFVR